MFSSLYGKLSLAFLAVFIFYGFCFAYFVHTKDDERHNQLAQLLYWYSAEGFADDIRASVLRGETHQQLYRSLYRSIRRQPNIDLYLLTESGQIEADFSLAGYPLRGNVDLEPIRKFLSRDAKSLAPIYGDDPRSKTERTIEKRQFSVAPITLNGHPYFVYLILGGEAEKILTRGIRDSQVISQMAIGLALSTFVAVGVGIFLFGYLTRPFRPILEVLSRFEAGDYSERLPDRRHDEFGLLSRAINMMADAITSQVGLLRQRDELRRELVGNISHDLRGPLALISGETERVLRSAGQPREGGQRLEYPMVVEKNTRLLVRLLTELQELSALEAKENIPQPGPVELDELFLDVELRFRGALQERNISFVRRNPDGPGTVLCDAVMIERALANLIENALRYVPPGGRILLSAADAGDSIRVCVEDTGSGVPSDQLPHIFERHRQGTGSGHGMKGLGLAIVQQIIKAHGGEIQVRSSPAGTEFAFNLPKYPQQPAEGSN